MALQSKLAASSASDSAPTLDGVDRLLLAQAEEAAADSVRRIAVVDAVTPQIFDDLGHLFPSATLVAHNDSLVDQRAVASSQAVIATESSDSSSSLYPSDLFAEADLVLVRLPKSLDALDELAQAAAGALNQDAVFIGAARTKHMTPTQNDVLGRYFSSVSASLGRFKSRALIASAPKAADHGALSPDHAGAGTWPRTVYNAEVDLDLVAHGGVFAGTRLDIGTRALLRELGELLEVFPEAIDFVDSGCGNGVLAAAVAKARPDARVTAVDVSRAAAFSATATAQANGLAANIVVNQDDALTGLPTASADVVVCNPPFHTGTTLDTDVAERMFEQARRVLRPGGELWTVFNTPLPYQGVLRRTVGRTSTVAQDRKFTVTRSVTPLARDEQPA